MQLNFPEFDGGAHVRVLVEDTSAHRIRRRRLPSPRLKLRITDCTNRIHLEFSVDSHESRANSLHKIETLIASLERFRRPAGRGGAASGPRGRLPNPKGEPMSYLKRFGTRRVPQSAPIPGSGQVPNSAGGHAWAVDDWARLRRFLILGTEGGSYYASESTLTRANADGGRPMPRGGRPADGRRDRAGQRRGPGTEERSGALRARHGGRRARRGDAAAALEALPQVCRTGTHLFHFATFVEGFRGWGRSLRRAVGAWYAARPADALAYQAVKYRRARVSHRDLLRLAHPAKRVSAGNPQLEVSDEHARLFEWIVRGGETDGLPRVVEGFVRAQAAGTADEAAALVREYGLPREAVKPTHLTSTEVWAALLEDMPMTALIRNLATMTRIGLLQGRSQATDAVVSQLRDDDRIRRARVHPIAVLAALRTYAPVTVPRPGRRGTRWVGSWTRSTPRSTPRSTTSSRPARGCCWRSTCPARWAAARWPACRA